MLSELNYTELYMFDFLPPENAATPTAPIVHEHPVGLRNLSWDIPLRQIAREHLANMSSEELDNDWRLNEFFGTVAVINLPQDTERLERITQELHAIGTYDFEVFPAIDGRKDLGAAIWMKLRQNRLKNDISSNEKTKILERLHQGEAGCYMSHYLLIKRTKEAFDHAVSELKDAISASDEFAIFNAKNKVRKYSRILILEDDNGFGIVNKAKSESSKNNAGIMLRKALQALPRRWDVLYLMCAAHQKTTAASEHLYKIKRSVFMNAYAVNYTMYDSIIAVLQAIEDPGIEEVLPVDKAVSNIHYLHRVYAIYPSIAFQFNGISTIDSTSTPTLTQCQPILKTNH